MRVFFTDGTMVEHVAATQEVQENGRLLLKTAEGDIVAELDPFEVARVEAIV